MSDPEWLKVGAEVAEVASAPDTQPCTRRQCRGWTEHSALRHWLGWWRR